MLFLLIACVPSGPVPDGSDRWALAHDACAEASATCDAFLADDFGLDDTVPPNTVEAFRTLVVWDLGDESSGRDPRGDYDTKPFLDLLDEWSGDTTAARLYNYMSAAVDHVYVANGDSLADYRDGEMRLSILLSGGMWVTLTPVLVHEATHATWPGHDDCDGRMCDKTWSGAYGAQASAAWLGGTVMHDAWLLEAAADAARHIED